MSVRDVYDREVGPDLGAHHGDSFKEYMGHKIRKLGAQVGVTNETISSIFKGCCIIVNGVLEIERAEVQRLITMHGGEFHVYQIPSKTTHFVCNNLPTSKLDKLKELKKEPRLKYVTCKWVTERYEYQAGMLVRNSVLNYNS